MSKNMFYYERKELLQPKEGDTELKFESVQSGFNINKVVMTAQMGNKLAVVLDDFHERIEEIPLLDKRGKQTGTKNKHYTHQSILYLEGNDIDRFKTLTSAE